MLKSTWLRPWARPSTLSARAPRTSESGRCQVLSAGRARAAWTPGLARLKAQPVWRPASLTTWPPGLWALCSLRLSPQLLWRHQGPVSLKKQQRAYQQSNPGLSLHQPFKEKMDGPGMSSRWGSVPATAPLPRDTRRTPAPGRAPHPEPSVFLLSRDSSPYMHDAASHGEPGLQMEFPEGSVPAWSFLSSALLEFSKSSCPVLPWLSTPHAAGSLTSAHQGYRPRCQASRRECQASSAGRLGPCTGARKAQHHLPAAKAHLPDLGLPPAWSWTPTCLTLPWGCCSGPIWCGVGHQRRTRPENQTAVKGIGKLKEARPPM